MFPRIILYVCEFIYELSDGIKVVCDVTRSKLTCRPA